MSIVHVHTTESLNFPLREIEYLFLGSSSGTSAHQLLDAFITCKYLQDSIHIDSVGA